MSNDKKTSILSFFWELFKIVVISLLIILPVRYFLVQPFFVRGTSMEPNFHNGEYLIVNEIGYKFQNPERGDVIIFKFPENPSQYYIKRIVGLPGETVEIEEGKITIYNDSSSFLLEENYINTITPGNITVTLDEDDYFVLGDNRQSSSDSRRWGALDERFIIGKVLLRAWPFDKFSFFETPTY